MNAKRLFSHRLALALALLAIVLIGTVGTGAAEPQPQGPVTTGFTYQGRLANDGGELVDDSCDFQFTLWDDPDAGSQAGPMLNPTGVTVADGLFTVPLDFGEVFDGTALWLQVAVKCTGDAAYVPLSPRQALTPAPYAAYALNAQTAGLLEGYPGSYYLDASNINSGTLGPGYYSAYDDLGIEGYLDDSEGDLARNNNVLQPTLNADLLDNYHASDLALAGHDHWGESWSGDGTGLTLSGGTVGMTATGTTYGVYGQSDSTSGYGVYGYTPADSGYTYGVYGKSDSYYGYGTYGQGYYGVYGQSDSTSGYGGYGVYGYAPGDSGYTYGVYGQSESPYGYGVYGLAQVYSGYAVGTYGRSESTSGRGVIGYVPSSTGGTMGVHGRSSSDGGFGVHGLADSYFGNTAGVFGTSNSEDAFGVAGDSVNYGVGVGAWSLGNLIEGYDGHFPGGTLRFYVEYDGDVYADGWYNTFKKTGDAGSAEYRTLYGMMSAEAWTEDFGRATLNNGTATVSIDPMFAQMVNLALEYHVYLTPICGDLIVLAVTDQQPDRFTVQGATLDGKASSCAFDYRIVAKQLGYEDQRLEKVDIPEPVEVDREDSHAPGPPQGEGEDGR